MNLCVAHHWPPEDAGPSWTPPLATTGLLCTGHAKRLERLLAEMPLAHRWLRANLVPGGSGDSDKISGTKSPPAPLRIEALDQADLIEAQLLSWAENVAQDRSLKAPVRPQDCAAMLRRQVGWIAEQEWVADLIAEVGDSVNGARRIAPWEAGIHRLPAPCPQCDRMTLTRRDGDSEVACDEKMGGCGAWWDEESYRRLVLILAQEAS